MALISGDDKLINSPAVEPLAKPNRASSLTAPSPSPPPRYLCLFLRGSPERGLRMSSSDLDIDGRPCLPGPHSAPNCPLPAP